MSKDSNFFLLSKYCLKFYVVTIKYMPIVLCSNATTIKLIDKKHNNQYLLEVSFTNNSVLCP